MRQDVPQRPHHKHRTVRHTVALFSYLECGVPRYVRPRVAAAHDGVHMWLNLRKKKRCGCFSWSYSSLAKVSPSSFSHYFCVLNERQLFRCFSICFVAEMSPLPAHHAYGDAPRKVRHALKTIYVPHTNTDTNVGGYLLRRSSTTGGGPRQKHAIAAQGACKKMKGHVCPKYTTWKNILSQPRATTSTVPYSKPYLAELVVAVRL